MVQGEKFQTSLSLVLILQVSAPSIKDWAFKLYPFYMWQFYTLAAFRRLVFSVCVCSGKLVVILDSIK